MSIFSSSPLYRLYLQSQPGGLNVIPNTSGVWNSATAKLFPFTKIELKAMVDAIQADYKTGNGSMLSYINGRSHSQFSLEAPLMPSGAAGTVPNGDPLLTNIFGGAPTVVASTSVTYNLADGASVPMVAALFNEAGGSITQQFGYGLVTSNFTLNVGGDGYLAITADGTAYWVLDSENWANETTASKGGLTSTPTTEPSSPALTGNMIPSFVASAITIGGNTLVELVSAQISGSLQRTMRLDGGNQFGTAIVQGRRSIGLKSLKFQDSDSSNLRAIKNLAKSKTPADVVIVQGSSAGYTLTHTMRNVQFDSCTYSESGGAVDVNFSDNPAHSTALANTDEYKIVLT